MVLSFANFTTLDISEGFFKDIAEKVFNREGIKEDVLVEVVLLGQSKMRGINKRYSGKNQVTDVLSFSESEIRKPTKKDIVFIQPKESRKNLGEVLLCPSRIKKNAKRLRKNFREELALVFVHSLLHLLGYNHIDTKTTKEMRNKEEEIMDTYASIWGLDRNK